MHARKKGIIQGREEGIKRIAKAMKEEGQEIDHIAKITGLASDDIKNL